MRTTTLNIFVNPSYALSAWILLCAGFALLVAYNLSIDLWAKAILIFGISSYTVYLYLREACRLLPSSWIKVQQLTATEWLLANRRNQPCAGRLRTDTFVSSWLVILRFDRIGNLSYVPKVMSVPLLFCDVKPEIWRELNIYLRWPAQEHLAKE